MKHPCHNRKHGALRCLNPLTMGLFFTASLLFAFSFVFYCLSFIPL